MKKESVSVTIEEFKPLLYFVISLFDDDSVHTSIIGNKARLLGEFIDKWINRLPENIIFDKIILKDKKYKVVTDYFMYSSADKNAPDVLGLTYQNKLIKFAEFNDTKWELLDDMPSIEVKTVTNKQYLTSVRKTQFKNKGYFVFVESEFRANYLKVLFNKEIFSDTSYNKIFMSEDFIKSNKKELIFQPKKIEFDDSIMGFFNLIGVFEGEKILKFAFECKGGCEFRYFKNLERKTKITKAIAPIKISTMFKLIDKGIYSLEYKGTNFVPIYIKNIENISLVKENKSDWYLCCDGEAVFNGQIIQKGNYYKVEYSIFEKNSSSFEEYFWSKSSLQVINSDKEKMIFILDEIFKKEVK